MFSARKEKPSTLLIKATSDELFQAIHSSDFASQTNAIFNWGICFLWELEEDEQNEAKRIQQHNLITVAIVTLAMAMQEEQYHAGAYPMSFAALMKKCNVIKINPWPDKDLTEIDVLRQFVFAVGNKILVDKSLPSPDMKDTVFAKYKFALNEFTGQVNSIGLSRHGGP
jgi:hypothetical protein